MLLTGGVMSRRAFIWWNRFLFLSGLGLATSGCAFLPGFGILEDPILYWLDVSEVANQVACELQEFMRDQQDTPVLELQNQRWLLGNEDVAVKLQLNTDNQGYVNFTGIDAAKLGFEAIANLITKQASVPSLGAKLTAKRSRTVQIAFTVSPKPVDEPKRRRAFSNASPEAEKRTNCSEWKKRANPASALYLKEWLRNYFATVNRNDDLSRFDEPYKMQSIQMTTAIVIGVDISGGATPRVLGNGNVFIVPVHGLTLDFNPSYTHKIDITMTVCDNSRRKDELTGRVYNPCIEKSYLTKVDDPLKKQCELFSRIAPLFKDVKSPRE